jgi:hypothetical protein
MFCGVLGRPEYMDFEEFDPYGQSSFYHVSFEILVCFFKKTHILLKIKKCS